MITGNRAMVWVVAVGIAASGVASAELPVLNDKEWLGHFVGYGNKKFLFGITPKGRGVVKLIGKKGEPVGKHLWFAVDFLVEEIKPDGTKSVRAILPETLETAQAATTEPKKIVFTGKVKGNASFEAFVDEEKGVISFGGRLVDPGTSKNPLKFSIQVKFPDFYSKTKKDGDKKVVEAFEEKIKDDRLQLTWSDGKRVKQATDKSVDVSSKEVNGPGITAVQVEFSSFEDKKVELVASANSSLVLSAEQSAPLYQGFAVVWTADPGKDPENKTRLSLEVK